MLVELKAALLEALGDPEVKARIAAIVVQSTPRAANDVDPDQLLTAGEAGALLGMSAPAVRMAAARRTIPAVHVGRRVRFRRTDLLRLLNPAARISAGR